MAYLNDHPPKQRQFRPRRQAPSGVVVIHTAESSPDWSPPDTGAESVARFIQNRSDYGSYHILCDSDSRIRLVEFDCEAYGDGTGSNPHAVHVSAATRADAWAKASPEWRLATVRQMAEGAAVYAKWLKEHHGIALPARRITRAESDRKVPGFLSHAERDPGRRSDPGKDFPWDAFLSAYAAAMKPTTKLRPLDKVRADLRLHRKRAGILKKAQLTLALKYIRKAEKL